MNSVPDLLRKDNPSSFAIVYHYLLTCRYFCYESELFVIFGGIKVFVRKTEN